MRVLIVDQYYPAFLAGLYRDHPGLEGAPYAEQLAEIHQGLFAESVLQVTALQELGHEAEHIIVNADRLQAAWRRQYAREVRAARPGWRLRRGIVPWPASKPDPWPTLLEQFARFTPDVVYVGMVDTMPAGVVRALAARAFVVGQVATRLPRAIDLSGYGLILSSIPALVDEFRARGLRAEWMPLAFDPRVAEAFAGVPRDIGVSFVGSLGDRWADRLEVLEWVADIVPIHVWTPNPEQIPAESRLRRHLYPPVFGARMYEVLARSRITINTHGIVSGRDANNLRLFEATGMGAMLLTDRRDNLGELFDVGRELVAFAGHADASALAEYYLSHLDEAAAIAEAGQARTRRGHTWRQRMAATMEFLATS